MWIVVDFGVVLVHIFHPDTRDYYRIEQLWESGTPVPARNTPQQPA